MVIEFMLYVFIGVGFFTGIVRGWKKQLCILIALFVALAAVIFTYDIVKEIVDGVYPVTNIYNIGIVKTIFEFLTVSEKTFEFFAYGVAPFVIVYTIVISIINAIVFSPKRIISAKYNEGSKLLGGLIGLGSGLLLGIFFMIFFATSTYPANFETGVIVKIVLAVPFIKSILASVGVVL